MKFTLKSLIYPQAYQEFSVDYDEEDYNTEVIVLIEEENEDGKSVELKYSAPFFTYKNIESVRKEHQESGDFIGGKYFWADRMLLIDTCNQENIEEVVRHLIDEGDFMKVFKSLS